MPYPFTIADKIEATEADLMSSINRLELTAGENIDASSGPLAVYLKAGDEKVWLTDTDADESTFKFIGFVGQAQNISADATCIVTTGGILGGFSGLTAGDRMYLGATAGVLGNVPISNQGVEIGIAISTTQIYIIQRSLKTYQGTDVLASDTGDVTSAIVCGFRPRIIHFYIEANDANEQIVSWGVWTEGVTCGLKADSNIPTTITTPLPNSFTDGRMQITFTTITDTGFTIAYDRAAATYVSQATVRFNILG